MAIDGHCCDEETEEWLLGDGQSAVEDYLHAVHEHNAALVRRDAGIPLPKDHYTGDRPVSTLTLLHALPLDVVSKVIWPLMMESDCHLENFRVCSTLRCVSAGWKEYVERQKEWTFGLVAYARHKRQMQEAEVEESTDVTTDSDSETESMDEEESFWSELDR